MCVCLTVNVCVEEIRSSARVVRLLSQFWLIITGTEGSRYRKCSEAFTVTGSVRHLRPLLSL